MNKIILVDDHNLVLNSLSRYVSGMNDCQVVGKFNNGKKLIEYLSNVSNLPDLILLDLNMPIMNGIQTMEWINANQVDVKVLVLSMEDDEKMILKMIKLGAKGYILKDCELAEFEKAIREIIQRGFYYNDLVTCSLVSSVQVKDEGRKTIQLRDRELEFLQLSSSDKTYKSIAKEMYLSPKTIDGYRESIFEKFGVKSRVAMVVYGIKEGLIDI